MKEKEIEQIKKSIRKEVLKKRIESAENLKDIFKSIAHFFGFLLFSLIIGMIALSSLVYLFRIGAFSTIKLFIIIAIFLIMSELVFFIYSYLFKKLKEKRIKELEEEK